jgi:tetrahydromethanopterin S-methyltransferase subunit F
MMAYNSLRLIGLLGLTGELVPVRHPAKRRRIKTVLQELMYRAAQFISKARQQILDFGPSCPVVAVFRAVQEDLLTGGRSP